MPKETEPQKLARLEKAGNALKNKKNGAGKPTLNTKGAKAALKKHEKEEAAKKKKAELKEKAKADKDAKKVADKAAKEEAKAKKAQEKADAKAKKDQDKAEKKIAKDKEKADKTKAKEEAKKKKVEMRDKPVMTLATTPDINSLSEASKKYARFTPSGLVMAKDTPFEQWQEIGAFLLGIEERWQFFIGDWMNFGESKYGEKYAQAINLFSKGYSTLANAAMVCRKFGPEARKAGLDFSIYLTLSRVPDDAKRIELLADAVKENWTVKEARIKSERAMPKKRKSGRGVPTSESGATGTTPTLSAEEQKTYEETVEKADALISFLRSKTFGRLTPSAKNQLGKVLAQVAKFYKELY